MPAASSPVPAGITSDGSLTCVTVPATAGGAAWGAVCAGNTYTYTASGWCARGTHGAVDETDPDSKNHSGFVVDCSGGHGTQSQMLCPSAICYSLVGKIDGASCFQLGSTGSFTASASGTLQLYFNDDQYGDNRGSYTCCIASLSTTTVTFVDAQGFEPQLDEYGTPWLETPIADTVDTSYNRVGALTDGASLIVVQLSTGVCSLAGWTVEVSDPDDDTLGAAQVGSLWGGDENSLPPLPSTLAEPGDTTITLQDGESAIFYLPPPSWAFGSATKTYDIQIQVFDPNNNPVATAPFTLYKPPLVLVHGLFGSSANWDGFKTRVDAAGFAVDIYRADYSPLNTAGFDAIYVAVPDAIRNAISARRAAGFAATRVDIVAHSMGTDATRWYMTPSAQLPNGGNRAASAVEPLLFKTPPIVASPRPSEDEFLRPDNFGIGDIRRFVTLGGVHTGTSICWQGIRMVNKGITASLERRKEHLKVWTMVEQIFNFYAIALDEPGEPDDVGMALVDLAARTHPFPNGTAPPRSVALTALAPIPVPYAPIEGVAAGGPPLSGVGAALFQIVATVGVGGTYPGDLQQFNSDMCVPSLSARNENPQNTGRTFSGVNHWDLTNNNYLNLDFFAGFFGEDETAFIQP